jgi:hypothetical protein
MGIQGAHALDRRNEGHFGLDSASIDILGRVRRLPLSRPTRTRPVLAVLLQANGSMGSCFSRIDRFVD